LWSIGKQAGDAATPALIDALRADSWVLRWSAARALGAIGSGNASGARGGVGALAKALRDGDSRICEAAAFALEEIGTKAREAVSALGEAATTSSADSGVCRVIDTTANAQAVDLDNGWTVRWAAVRALGVVGAGNPDALPHLKAALKDEQWQVRGVAALALGRFKAEAPTAVQALIAALKDEHPAVRRAATLALADMGSAARDAVPLLRAAARDADAAVSEGAKLALTKLSGG
jgi:HEAT repeat protein